MEAMDPAGAEGATRELLAASPGGACVGCQAPLASDQRYCVNCGERRGKARFSIDTLMARAEPGPAPAEEPRRGRVSASTTLVAGVATLLLAMGLGFMIGHNSGSNAGQRLSSLAPQVIKIQGGIGGPTRGAGRRSLGAFKATTVPKLSTKQVAAANNAANKVLGSQASKRLAPVTVQPGQACSHGAGCQNGKFTGNFFQP